MVRLVTADDPDVVCLQEVPVWALGRSGRDVCGARVVGLLRTGGRHRPDLRARPARHAFLRLARGAPARRRPPALRPRARGGLGRMTFEEARAQFPVLEHYAYLNAGTNGPLARATVEALVAEAERDLAAGRSGRPYIDRILQRREEARQGLAPVLGVDPAHVAAVDST